MITFFSNDSASPTFFTPTRLSALAIWASRLRADPSADAAMTLSNSAIAWSTDPFAGQDLDPIERGPVLTAGQLGELRQGLFDARVILLGELELRQSLERGPMCRPFL